MARKQKPFKIGGWRHEWWYLRTFGFRLWWKQFKYRPQRAPRKKT